MFDIHGTSTLHTTTMSKSELYKHLQDLQSGGTKDYIDAQECLEHFKNGTMDETLLKRCNTNEDDPNHVSTKCRGNRDVIAPEDYEKAQAHFNDYYDKHNTTDSGRLRGKMFDIKYNKKGKDLLYFGEPCSAKYIEEDGPKKYDLWYVDAFPQGTRVTVGNHTIYTQSYDDIAKSMKYGPAVTQNHMIRRIYNEIYAKEYDDRFAKTSEKAPFRDIKDDEERKKVVRLATRQAILQDSIRAFENSKTSKHMFHQYFRERQAKLEQDIPLQVVQVVAEDSTVEEDVSEVSHPLDIDATDANTTHMPSSLRLSDVFDDDWEDIFDESDGDGEEDEIITSTIIRKADYDTFARMVVVNVRGNRIPVLYDPETTYVYEIPFHEKILRKYSEISIERYIHAHSRPIFDKIAGTNNFRASGKITMKGLVSF